MDTITRACPYCGQEATYDIEQENTGDSFLCKFPTDNGPCERGVDEPTARCWQHTDD